MRQSYEDLIDKINQQLGKIKNEQDKNKSEPQNKYPLSNYGKDSIISSTSFSTMDFDQSLSFISDISSETDRYIDIHQRNNNYKKSIEKKKNQIDLLNKKMAILKQKIKMKEEQNKTMDSKINSICQAIDNYDKKKFKHEKTNANVNNNQTTGKTKKKPHNRNQSSNTYETTIETSISNDKELDNIINNLTNTEKSSCRSGPKKTSIKSPKTTNRLHHHSHHSNKGKDSISKDYSSINNNSPYPETFSTEIETNNDVSNIYDNTSYYSTNNNDTNDCSNKKSDEYSTITGETISAFTPKSKSKGSKKYKHYCNTYRSNGDESMIEEVQSKEELFWLQQKFVELQKLLKEKDNIIKEKDKNITELNDKLHEANQMSDEVDWLHRKFIEYQETIEKKDKIIEELGNEKHEKQSHRDYSNESNEIITESKDFINASHDKNMESNGSFIEYSDVDNDSEYLKNRKSQNDDNKNNNNSYCSSSSGKRRHESHKMKKSKGKVKEKENDNDNSKKLTWSNDLIQSISSMGEEEMSSIIDEECDDNNSDDSFIDNRDQIIEDQKQFIKELENTIEKLYTNTSSSVMVQTDEVINYCDISDTAVSDAERVNNEPLEDTWIFKKAIGLKTVKVEVRNHGTLAKLSPKNDNYVIPNFIHGINQSVNALNQIRSQIHNQSQNQIHNQSQSQIQNQSQSQIQNQNQNQIQNQSQSQTLNVTSSRDINNLIDPGNEINNASQSTVNGKSQSSLKEESLSNLSPKERKKREKEMKKEMKKLEKERKKMEKEKAKREKEEAKKEKQRLKKEMKEQKKKK